MPEITVGLFAEDRGHAEFVDALVKRIGREEGRSPEIRVISGAGGHRRALSEFKVSQRSIIDSVGSMPSLVVVVVDANCTRWNEARGVLRTAVDRDLASPVIIACPDPHVERWYLADPQSFHQVVGASVPVERRKCERDRYKAQLRDAVKPGGNIRTLGGIEFAKELVDAMDLYRAGQNDASLRAFIDETRAELRQI